MQNDSLNLLTFAIENFFAKKDYDTSYKCVQVYCGLTMKEHDLKHETRKIEVFFKISFLYIFNPLFSVKTKQYLIESYKGSGGSFKQRKA